MLCRSRSKRFKDGTIGSAGPTASDHLGGDGAEYRSRSGSSDDRVIDLIRSCPFPHMIASVRGGIENDGQYAYRAVASRTAGTHAYHPSALEANSSSSSISISD